MRRGGRDDGDVVVDVVVVVVVNASATRVDDAIAIAIAIAATRRYVQGRCVGECRIVDDCIYFVSVLYQLHAPGRR